MLGMYTDSQSCEMARFEPVGTPFVDFIEYDLGVGGV